MEETTINSYTLATMCRLCLSRGDVTMFDVFSFLRSFKIRIADVIMKCAPVQILRRDAMPKFICRLCYKELEKSYQFQMQAIQSDKTIRHYLDQLNTFDKKPKLEDTIQSTSEDPLIDNESLELHGMIDSNVTWPEQEHGHFISVRKITDIMSLKSEIKDEQIDDNSIISPDCADDTEENLSKGGEFSRNIGDSNLAEDGNGKLEESTDFLPACKTNAEKSLKYVIKDEPIDGSSLILTESIVDTINSSSNDGGSEISCEDTKIGFGHTSENTACIRSTDAYADENFERCEDKDTSSKRRHTGEKPFQCDVCNKCFNRLSRLKVHKRIHTGERPYQCDVCKKCFIESNYLKIHKRIHTGEKPNQCDVCNKCFIQSGELKIHKRIHSGERPYQCDVCKQTFTDSGNLKVHKRIHTGEKPYQCDVCNKRFNQSNKLKNHKRIHTGERPYQCDVCKKCFTESTPLKIHKRIHTGEKPNQCDVCNKCFIRSSDLKIHKRIHSGERPYQCNMCNKRLISSSALEVHKRVHIDEKPYRCDVCKKCFAQLSYLNTHMRCHTGEKPYKCDVCNKCFTLQRTCNRHCKTVHKGEKI